MTVMDKLRATVQEGRAVFVVGTGLSISCTKGSPAASWIGLLEESIEWAKSNLPDVTDSWVDLVRGTLDTAKDDNDTSVLISAAGLIANKISAGGVQARSNWLKETVGDLMVADSSWPEALHGLRSPILTTNYDTLIEDATGRPSANWTNPHEVQGVISRQSQAVGHLHGVWNQEDSIVLSDVDYERALKSEALQALERAASSVMSMVFVGVGDGLDDPNFSRLLEWHRRTFASSAVTHYRLCREEELAELTQKHGRDNITPVSYGRGWDELPEFLKKLEPENNAVAIVQNRAELARDTLASKVRVESIVCENLDDIEERPVHQLISAPVLMPLSQEQLRAAEASGYTPEQIQRADPDDVAQHTGVTIISGADGSGRTMALCWLLEAASKWAIDAVPLMTSAADLHRGGRPLVNALKRRSREAGLGLQKDDPFPPMVIGIDDLSPYNTRLCEQVVDDLRRIGKPPTFITCQEGHEAELASILLASGFDAEIRFVGELSRNDIRELVRLASPSRAKVIEDSVVSILKQQHLPRTPFTVSLLISVLIGGNTVGANSSHTTLLDLYLHQLLGRDDLSEDSRWGMDVDLRSAVLQDLAQHYMYQKSAAMPESEVVTRLEKYFSDRGIPESAADLLLEFRALRVLTYEDTLVRFTNISYLYLFAAKAATKNKDLRDYLLRDVLLFAPALKHYPSLERSDGEFVNAVERAFDNINTDILSGQSLHARVRTVQAPEDLEERLERMGENAARQNANPPEFDEPTEEPADDLAMYPRTEYRDSALKIPADLPDFHRYALALDVLSTALRDSVLVADPQMKARILSTALRGWGKLGSLFEEDTEMVEAMRQVVVSASEMLDLPDDRREAFVRLLADLSPAIVIAGGVSASLSTTRLIAALSAIIADPEFRDDADGALGAAILILDVQHKGWVRDIERVTENHKDSRVVANSIKFLCLAALDNAGSALDDPVRLKRYISDLESRRISFGTDAARQRFRNMYEQRVLNNKRVHREIG
ncbi:SIR2 family protein [Arthrobacter sp. zg-Y411]|uniref:SIR2 family protein n=1 Tax=Arthrobacter zhangbolii TaxID=2886936 RepID=UPI001D15A6DC|nr:SIR2 family protein [Arthrobacter zhangbolii]MCC3294268.1 SIR2 family protein [Arthrobacter zhangbolii]